MKGVRIFLASLFAVVLLPAHADTPDAAETADLMFMVEEEKLAHDVYLTFQRRYSERVFPNIRRSEQRHMDAVAGLLKRYGLENPSKPGVGEFTDESLQALYDRLVAEGMKGRVEAIKVGALIEEKDMEDIVAAIGRTDEPAIERAYGNLLDGSKSHLRAFVGRLARLGVDYRPVILSQDEYEAIVGD